MPPFLPASPARRRNEANLSSAVTGAPGQADRTIEGVLPKDAKAGAYEVALAPCDFAPGSAIASAPLQVK